jgi:hypothetical protein
MQAGRETEQGHEAGENGHSLPRLKAAHIKGRLIRDSGVVIPTGSDAVGEFPLAIDCSDLGKPGWPAKGIPTVPDHLDEYTNRTSSLLTHHDVAACRSGEAPLVERVSDE